LSQPLASASTSALRPQTRMEERIMAKPPELSDDQR
jgi:hypothetical protein